MINVVKNVAVTIYATAFGVLGFSFSVVAIAVRWLPFITATVQPTQRRLEPPVHVTPKTLRRRSAPIHADPKSAPLTKRRRRKRPTSAPAGIPEDVSSPPNSARRVCFADSGSPKAASKAASSRITRLSIHHEEIPIMKPILNSPDSLPPQSSPRLTSSPQSSVSSVTTLAHSSVVTSLSDEALDSDSSSTRPSLSNYLPRLPKISNPLARVRRKSGPERPPPLAVPESPSTTKPARRSSLGWSPWPSPRRPNGTEGQETSVAQLESVPATNSEDDEGTTVTTTTATSVVSIVSAPAAYFGNKRRSSTPIPRTQPYAYPINAAYPTVEEEHPPPYESPTSMDPCLPPSFTKQDNAKAQAALGVGGGGRRPVPRRTVTYGG